MDLPGRWAKLRDALAEEGVDALVVNAMANVRYLSGFSGSAGLVVAAADGAWLLTDGRYAYQAPEEVRSAGAELEVRVAPGGGQMAVLSELLSGRARVGLEAHVVTWQRQQVLANELRGCELVPTTGLVESLRRVKDEGELARMSTAARIADEALAEILPGMEGATESDVALALDSAMRRRGASGSAFETIVAAGPNAAKPHARPSTRQIGVGELVVIDYGATYAGYRSDATRTVCLGEPSDPLAREVVGVVAASQSAGLAALSVGLPAAEADRAAREVVERAGFGEAFMHSTGHGVGLDVHEAPALAARSTDRLERGAVVTVEPGVYLEGRLGVRIEDMVVVTTDGYALLSTAPKELVVA